MGLRNSAAAVSLVVLPPASRSAICSSRGVSASTVLGSRRRASHRSPPARCGPGRPRGARRGARRSRPPRAAARGRARGFARDAAARRRRAACAPPRRRRASARARGAPARTRPAMSASAASSPSQRGPRASDQGWPFARRRGRELGGHAPGVVDAAEPQVGIDELGRRREVDVGDRELAQDGALTARSARRRAPRCRARARAHRAPPPPRLWTPHPEAPRRARAPRRRAPALRPARARGAPAATPARRARTRARSPDRSRGPARSPRGRWHSAIAQRSVVAWSRATRLSTNGSAPTAARSRAVRSASLEQRPAGAGLAQEDRPDRQPGEQLEIVAQLGRALGERDRLADRRRAGAGVTAEDRAIPSAIAARKRARAEAPSGSARAPARRPTASRPPRRRRSTRRRPRPASRRRAPDRRALAPPRPGWRGRASRARGASRCGRAS